MFTIRCTSKLFKRTGLQPEATLPLPNTALGNWYANLIHLGKTQLLLFVSESSLLPVITPAKNSRALREHLIERLPVTLRHLRLPNSWIEAEIAAMDEVHFARTDSRNILGSMTDFKKMLEVNYEGYSEDELLEPMNFLIDCPCKPIDYKSPGDVTQKLFKDRYGME